jgi:hypothetical protein
VLLSLHVKTLRFVWLANFLGIELEFLEVAVTGDLDARGTIAIDQKVPVGFQAMRCNVRLHAKDGTNQEHLKALRVAAELCCFVQQTLCTPPPVETTFEMS